MSCSKRSKKRVWSRAVHESAIAQSIVSGVKDEISARKLHGTVEKVHLRVGKLHAVIPDSLTFHFDVLKKGTAILKTARLEIDEIPIRAACSQCKTETILEEPFFLCTDCGGILALKTGQEMFIERISFNEETRNGN